MLHGRLGDARRVHGLPDGRDLPIARARANPRHPAQGVHAHGLQPLALRDEAAVPARVQATVRQQGWDDEAWHAAATLLSDVLLHVEEPLCEGCALVLLLFYM
eukprot:3121085-Alexandrium_andersonii.AAC.1